MKQKIIIPRQNNLYSSFPTMTTDDKNLYIFYRRAKTDEDYILNESSIVFHDGLYTIFMRDNKLPFRIWTAESSDLKQWTKPAKLMTHAHAPMTLLHNNKLFLTFRDLSVNQLRLSVIASGFFRARSKSSP